MYRILDTLHLGLLLHAVYHYLVTEYDKPFPPIDIVWYVIFSSGFGLAYTIVYIRSVKVGV